MANIQEIEHKWVDQFHSSLMVMDGVFNADLAAQLFYGFDDPENAPFEMPFLEFYMGLDPAGETVNLQRLVAYLAFIGMDIQLRALETALKRGTFSYDQMLQRAHDIFKYLATAKHKMSLEHPFKPRIKDFYFFLLLELQSGSPAKVKRTKEAPNSSELNAGKLPDFYNKFVEIPPGYEEDEVAMQLFDKLENTDKSIFITGKAGTGKSTFIHYFVQNTTKEVLVLAFTGIAAINIGGQTIHSFFRLPLKPLLPGDEEITIFKRFWQNYKILKNVDTIIIDEVSMLRSDVLEAMDYSIRRNGGDPGRLFGGKQMIFVGDIFQLPPVVNQDDPVQAELFSSVYKSQYFFDANAYRKLSPESFEFRKIHRQSNLEFVALLNAVRDCSIDTAGIEALNKRYQPDAAPDPETFTIMLTSTNRLAKAENRRRLNELSTKSYFFKADTGGQFGKDRYPTEELLELREGAQVMFVRNDPGEKGRRWVNGTIAVIDDIGETYVKVRMKNGKVHQLVRETWENTKYEWDREAEKITSNVIGTFEQYPIKLAWAVTIHKSQGLTFDNVIIDLGSGAFVNGQLYTALSRCRTLDGIALKQRISLKDVVEDERLIAFDAEIGRDK